MNQALQGNSRGKMNPETLVLRAFAQKTVKKYLRKNGEYVLRKDSEKKDVLYTVPNWGDTAHHIGLDLPDIRSTLIRTRERN